MPSIMPTIKDYIEKIAGVCGAEQDIIVIFRSDKKEAAIANIIDRSITKKTCSGYMFELEFEGMTFRLFSSGRAVFRSIKSRKELNRILTTLLL